MVEAIDPASGDVYAWDVALPRFGLRVTPAGSRIYLVQYRTRTSLHEPPRTRRITIGQHGRPWTIEKARDEARQLLAAVDLRRDPFAEREADLSAKHEARLAAERAASEQAREEARRERENFEAMVELFVERKAKKNRTWAETERLLRHGPVKTWGERHVGEIRRADVAELLENIAQRSPSVARATYAALRPLFDWCVERDFIPISPCERVTAPPRPKARDRVLADDELRLVWKAAEHLGFPFGPVVHLLALTGQRRSEVAGMQWSELDLKASHWRIPAERSKNRQAHEIDLSPQALEVIGKLPRVGELLFPARGEGSVRGFSAAKRHLDRLVEEIRLVEARKARIDGPEKPLPAWRLHDLRRTAATGMAGLGFPPHVVERVLNHVSGSQSGLVGVYQRHEYRPERKAALLSWGAYVQAVSR